MEKERSFLSPHSLLICSSPSSVVRMCFEYFGNQHVPVSPSLLEEEESKGEEPIGEQEEEEEEEEEEEVENDDDGVKCRLVKYDELPEYLKDNEFILDHYRSEWPIKQTILSIFSIHNETINVWTHLIGFLMFLLLTFWTSMVIPREAGAIEISHTQRTCHLIAGFESQSSWKLGDLALSDSSSFSCSDDLFQSISSPNPTTAENLTRHDFTEEEQGEFQEEEEEEEEDDDDSIIKADSSSTPVPRWPFFFFLFGSMACLLTSSICHLVSCHSCHASSFMLRLDYAGISTLIVTSFYPVVYYSFLCHPFFQNLYITTITVTGITTVLLSLIPVFQTAAFRPVRAGVFFFMGVSGLVPILHKLVLFGDRPEVVLSAAYEATMGVFYGAGVLIYVTRVPERWSPGRFDLVGHSHQLFHVLVMAGAYSHYLAGLVYLKWRDVDQC